MTKVFEYPIPFKLGYRTITVPAGSTIQGVSNDRIIVTFSHYNPATIEYIHILVTNAGTEVPEDLTYLGTINSTPLLHVFARGGG